MKVFILIFRLMLLYFGLKTITQLFWLLSSYIQMVSYGGEIPESYNLQTFGIIGHFCFLGLLVAAWLLPRKFLGILPGHIDSWATEDLQKLNDKLPQLVVFGVGLFSLLSAITLMGDYLFNWFITYGTSLTAMTFGPTHFWTLLWITINLAIPLTMMYYSKPISRFFIK